MKKIFLLIICIAISLALVACGNSAQEDNNNDDQVKENYGTATVFAPGDTVQMISTTAEGRAFLEYLKFHLDPILRDENGNGGTIIGSQYSNNADMEIVVGMLDETRPATVKAYKVLERMERENYFDMRYVVYADSGCIAIAYDENEYTNLKILDIIDEQIVEMLTKDKEYIAYAKGVISDGTVDMIGEQELLDIELMSEQWANLEATYGKDFADSCKVLYSLYGDDLVEWVANLYDPGIGGFYASSGGRDGAEFGPDLQCTVQLLRFIVSTGMVDNIGTDWTEFVPEFMQQQMVYFGKSLQDSQNGFFYHPQWGKAAVDSVISRRGRDLGWGQSLLAGFGYSPTYNTPDGTKGDGITADEYWDSLVASGEALGERPYGWAECPVAGSNGAAPLTEELGGDAAVAVSKLVMTASTILQGSYDTNTYTKSHVGFINYVLVRVIPGIHANPYNLGNEVGSAGNELREASKKLGVYSYTPGDEANTPGATADDYKQFDGKTLVEMLTDTLIEHINPQTGLWGDLTAAAPKGTEFRYTNGFMKTIGSLTGNGVAYPIEFIPLAANALVDGILGDEPSTSNCCDIYNAWTNIGLLKNNLKLIDDAALRKEVEATVDSILQEKAPAAILNTYEKIKGYKKYDGGFAHNYYRGTGMHQNLPVGIEGLNQSDVDGTCISSTGLLRAMFDALKVPSKLRPSMYTESDWMRMLEIFLSQSRVIKYDYNGGASGVKLYDFESELPPESHLFVQNANANNTFERVELSGRGGVGLFSKTEANRQLYLDFKVNSSEIGANAVYFETDIMFSDLQSCQAPVELRLYNGTSTSKKIFTLYFHVNEKSDGKTVYVSDNSSGNGKVAIGKIGEFINVRLAYFEGVADDPNSPASFKVYINGSSAPAYVSETFQSGSAIAASQVGMSRFIVMGAFLGKIYFDNTGFVREKLEYAYDAPTSGTSTPQDPVAPPVTDDKEFVYFDYENGIPAKKYLTVQNSSTGNTFTAVKLGDKSVGLFSKTETNKQLYLDFKINSDKSGANATLFESDLMFTELTSATAPVELRLYNGTNSSAKIFTLYFHVNEKTDGSTVYISDDYNGKNKVAVGKIGEWFKLRLVYFEESEGASAACFKAFINGGAEPAFVSETFQSGSAIPASSVGFARFIVMGAFLGKIYFDNTGFIREIIE